MTDQTTSPTLLRDVADAHNRGAWSRFEARYRPLILLYCRRLGLQVADAEDVSQDVLTSLAHAMSQFQYDRRRGRFRSYLGQSVRRAVARHLRRQSSPAVDDDFFRRLAGPTDAHWDHEWMQYHCRCALDEVRRDLSPYHAEILDHLIRGDDVSLTARETGMNVEAVRKTKQRLRERLRETVQRQLEAEERFGG